MVDPPPHAGEDGGRSRRGSDVSWGPLSYQKTVTPWLQAFSVPLRWTVRVWEGLGEQNPCWGAGAQHLEKQGSGDSPASHLTVSSIPAALRGSLLPHQRHYQR